jgi:hypothetical protein
MRRFRGRSCTSYSIRRWSSLRPWRSFWASSSGSAAGSSSCCPAEGRRGETWNARRPRTLTPRRRIGLRRGIGSSYARWTTARMWSAFATCVATVATGIPLACLAEQTVPICGEVVTRHRGVVREVRVLRVLGFSDQLPRQAAAFELSTRSTKSRSDRRTSPSSGRSRSESSRLRAVSPQPSGPPRSGRRTGRRFRSREPARPGAAGSARKG